MPDLPPCRWSARRVVRCRPSRCRCRAPCCTFRRAGPSPRDAAEVADLVARRHSSGWVLVERRGDRGERRRVSNRCAGLAPRPRTGPSQESRPPRGTDTVPGARPATTAPRPPASIESRLPFASPGWLKWRSIHGGRQCPGKLGGRRVTDRWYREAVIYCVQVDLFRDSNGDGCGDLRGLISRLDYLSHLGITCLWLNPIHPSPLRDGGYDVADYYGVHPRLGSLGDFADLTLQAAQRGIRIVLDLVVNHTSDQHPWFQSARSRPGIAVPGLVRLVRHGARRSAAGHRLSRASRPRPGPTTRRPRPGTSTGSTISSRT